MGEKEKILSKFNIKDYRNELELILENKHFDEEAKSLLLNIFYKIDNFYKDYSTVKKESENKNKFLEDYMSIIKNKCNKIEVLPPQDTTKTKRYELNKENGQIKTFPSENILMYAVYELAEVQLKGKDIDFTNKCILNMLNKGNTINSTEPIRDFNGWSWNVEINNTKNIEYNLIFQNLLILLGYNFVYENLNTKNILELLRPRLVNKIYKKTGAELLDCLLQIAIILYNNNSLKNHKECLEYKKSIQEDINNLRNKQQYINNMTKNNMTLITEIQRLDLFLNDINAIRKAFYDEIKSGKNEYFSLSDFVEAKEKEKEELQNELNSNNKSLSPKEYLKHQDEDKRILRIYENIKEETTRINLQSKILKLQKLFLECFKLKIMADENKKDLYVYATQLRYYANIPYKKYKSIVMQDKVSEVFEEVSKVLVDKMLDSKVIDLGFKNRNLNYNIVKYIFKSKVMKLDNFVLRINFIGNDEIEVEYYDGNMLDYKAVFEIPFDEEISSRKSKKIKLFKISG